MDEIIIDPDNLHKNHSSWSSVNVDALDLGIKNPDGFYATVGGCTNYDCRHKGGAITVSHLDITFRCYGQQYVEMLKREGVEGAFWQCFAEMACNTFRFRKLIKQLVKDQRAEAANEAVDELQHSLCALLGVHR